MAAHTKRRNREQKAEKSQLSGGRWLLIGVGLLVFGLLAFGMLQIFDARSPGVAIQAGRQSGAEVAEPVVNRETRFLGPANDPASVSLAEAGELGQPTLVWFHADWCHVCQQVKPEVVNLGEEFDGKVKVVRLNVDYSESRSAVQRYGVRATPTFVLLDASGQVRGNVPGWPGYQAFTDAFDQLLAGG